MTTMTTSTGIVDRRTAFAGCLAIGAGLCGWGAIAADELILDPHTMSLDEVEERVARAFDVPTIRVADLERLVAAGRVTLFDARTEDEFRVSHMAGATRLDPDASAEDILEELAAAPAGQPIVVYCAVGVRSSRVLARAGAAGALPRGVAHLRGGLFRWYASGGGVVAADGTATAHIHHFDADWRALLERTSARR